MSCRLNRFGMQSLKVHNQFFPALLFVPFPFLRILQPVLSLFHYVQPSVIHRANDRVEGAAAVKKFNGFLGGSKQSFPIACTAMPKAKVFQEPEVSKDR